MDDLFPQTTREIALQRSACICSVLQGDTPYMRGFGIDARLDAAVPSEAQRLLGSAAAKVEAGVPGVRVTRGTVTADSAGRAVVRLAIAEVK